MFKSELDSEFSGGSFADLDDASKVAASQAQNIISTTRKHFSGT